jgi:hypothetical protein
MSGSFLTSPRQQNVTFDKPCLVLVEGADDQAVIDLIIKHEELDNFQVHDMMGKDSWREKLRAISLAPEFDLNVVALALIRDADTNPNAAWDSCRGALSEVGLAQPARVAELTSSSPAVGVVIVPSMAEQGAIEELCIKSFAEGRMACVDAYFHCLDGASAGSIGSGKARSQVYLAGNNPLFRDLRLAAQKRQIDVAHGAFDELRGFLRAMSVLAQ